jgi:hypothetical protein
MHRTRAIIATATTTCVTVLALAWPTVTQATDPADAPAPSAGATIDPDTTEVGNLLATSRLVAHPKYPGMVNLELTVKNPSTDTPTTATLDAVVFEQAFNEDSRGGPMPKQAWHKQESLTVGPGQVVSRVYTLPANLSFHVTQARAAEERAERTGELRPRGVSYYAEIVDAAPEADEAS